MIKKHGTVNVQGNNNINGNFGKIVREKLSVDLGGPYNT